MLPHVHTKYMYHIGQLIQQTELFFMYMVADVYYFY